MDNSTIRLRDDEVDLSKFKIGDVCEITIKGIMKGMEEREEYKDGPQPVDSKAPAKKPKKYIEYNIEVQKAKEEDNEKGKNWFKKDSRVGELSTK